MRCSFGWAGIIVSLCLSSLAQAANATAAARVPHNLNITALLALPDCVKECGAQILPVFQCAPTDACFCETSGSLAEALGACVAKTCTSLEGPIASLKIQADACGFPVRSKRSDANVAYVLFGVSTVFLIVRIVSRLRLGLETGLGLDDLVVILCFPAMVGMVVVVYHSHQFGSGQDVWEVPFRNLAPFLHVCRSLAPFPSPPLSSGSTDSPPCSGFSWANRYMWS